MRCQSGMGFSPSQARLYSLLTYNGVEDVLAEEMVRNLEGFEPDDHQGLRRALARDLLQKIQLAPPSPADRANGSQPSSDRPVLGRRPRLPRSLPTPPFGLGARLAWSPWTPIELLRLSNWLPTARSWDSNSRSPAVLKNYESHRLPCKLRSNSDRQCR